jgi:hypothetical protein
VQLGAGRRDVYHRIGNLLPLRRAKYMGWATMVGQPNHRLRTLSSRHMKGLHVIMTLHRSSRSSRISIHLPAIDALDGRMN